MAAGEPIGNASNGTYVFMLLLGFALAPWPLAVITNFRGYRDSHARRGERATEWVQRAVGGRPGPPPSASDRRFNTVMQYVVAIGFLAAATALIVVATVQLVTRVAGNSSAT